VPPQDFNCTFPPPIPFTPARPPGSSRASRSNTLVFIFYLSYPIRRESRRLAILKSLVLQPRRPLHEAEDDAISAGERNSTDHATPGVARAPDNLPDNAKAAHTSGFLTPVPVSVHSDISLFRHLSHRAYSPSRPSLSHRPHTSKPPRRTVRQRPPHRESTTQYPQGRHPPHLPPHLPGFC
jgi:hypothetical protein